MTSDAEILAVSTPEIEREEALCLHAVPDPLSHAEPWTVGYGATGPDIGPDTVWTQEHATEDLGLRQASIIHYFDTYVPWWRSMNAARCAVLLSMGYNMGKGFIHTWPHFMAACQTGDYAAAAEHMLDPPTWKNQVHTRATTLADQMRTGIAT